MADQEEKKDVATSEKASAVEAIEKRIAEKHPEIIPVMSDIADLLKPTNKAAPDQAEEDPKAAQDSKPSSDPKDSQETSTEEPAKESKLSDKQLQAAKHLRYTDDEIADMTPLEVKKLEQASRRLRQKESKLGRMEQELKARQKAEPLIPDKSDAEDDEDDTFFDDEPAKSSSARQNSSELSVSDDPEKWVNKVNAMAKTIADLKGQVESSQNQDATTKADQFFDELDQSVFDQFGKGKTSSFDSDSYEAESRQKVIGRATKLQAMASDDGETISFADALDTALSMVAKDQYKQSMTSATRTKVKDLQKRAPARASHDRTKTQSEVSDRDRQVANIEKKIRAKGIPVV